MNDYINVIFNVIDVGCDVCGYYVWFLFDFYFWKNGVEKCYGFVVVDFENN